ncbi:MAG: amidohydrolase family protein [Acidobacteriota bacterium]
MERDSDRIGGHLCQYGLLRMSITVYIANWILPVSSAPIENGAIAVSGEQILAVGTDTQVAAYLAATHQDYNIVKLVDAAILPGLVNVHSHLELTVMRGYLQGLAFPDWLLKLINGKRRLTTEQLNASAIWGACEAARAGITTLADTGSRGAALYGLMAVGLRGIVYQEVFGPDPKQVDSSLDELKLNVAALTARCGRLVQIGVSPHAPYTVSAPLFRQVARYAISERLPIAVHAAESEYEEQLVRTATGRFAEQLRQRGIELEPAHCSVIEYLDRVGVLDAAPLLIHAIRVCEQDLQLITSSGSSVAHCPKSNAQLGNGRAPLGAMLSAGVRIGLGTDGVVSNNVYDLLDEARFCSLLHYTVEANAESFAGLVERFGPRAMIKLMTLNGAIALGMEDRIGTLAAGKQADFIVVGLRSAHLVPVHDIEATILYSAAAADIRLTVVAGREVFRDGLILAVDEEEIRQVIDTAAQVLRGEHQ